MTYLVTGAGGQLGRAVLAEAQRRGLSAIGRSHTELPVEDADVVHRQLAEIRPKAVLHCAAWTDVDGCEGDPERAELINGRGAARVAEACREIRARLVYVSTDFVFDGQGTRPYREDDPVAPLSVYGQSKLAGERAVLEYPGFAVARTSWLFGPGGRNFPKAILARAKSGEPLRVVNDQTGSPTLTLDLAAALLDLAQSDAPGGVYHAANDGSCTWHEFAQQILARAGLGDVTVDTMSSAELGRPAARPAYSVLDCSKLAAVRGGKGLPHYLDGLDRYLATES